MRPNTRKIVDEYSRSIAKLTEVGKRALFAKLESVDWADITAGANEAVRIVEQQCGRNARLAANVTARFYDGIRQREAGSPLGAEPFDGRVPEATENAVRGFVNSIIEGDVAQFERLCGERLDYEVHNAARSTVGHNAKRDSRRPRYAVVPSGDCCDFCAMLASRGPVYRNPDDCENFHPNCTCSAVPTWEQDEDGNYVLEMEGYDRDYYLDRYEHPERYKGRSAEEFSSVWHAYVAANPEEDLVAASYNFMNRGDELYERIQKVKPIDGFSDYGIHSDGYSFDRLNEKSSQPVDVFTLAQWIRSDPNYPGGNVRLLSCRAGAYEDGAAKVLAELLNVTVRAPDADLYVNRLGEYNIARSMKESLAIFRGEIDQSCHWVDFTPDGASRVIDG